MLKTLKKLSWDDKWQNYIQYGQAMKPLFFDAKGRLMCPPLPEPCVLSVLSVMHQLEGKMTVYEAFLKGIEFIYSSHTYNQDGSGLQKLIKLKKAEIRNLKKGIFDEEFSEYIAVATKGYKKWCLFNNGQVTLD